jgi:uncharacterized protein (TIGR02996 family)
MSGVKVGKMTDDELGLLRAILAEPPEDMHRLRYADWLEEHAREVECRNTGCERGRIWTGMDGMKWIPCPDCSGSGRVPDSRRERAEFIRVQVELEARFPGWSGTPANESLLAGGDYHALRQRERECMGGAVLGDWFNPEPHNRKWHYFLAGNEPAGLVPYPFLVIRRGFVEAVSCDMATFAGWPCRCRDIVGADGTLVPDPPPYPFCPVCDGDRNYRTPGIAPALFACQPVREVDIVPQEVLNLFPDLDPTGAWTNGELRQSVSNHLVSWGRRAAGLPPLPGR